MVKKIDAVEEYIFKQKKVSVTELQKEFNLSESTVRRYINTLLDKKSITKEYGSVSANIADNLIHIRSRIDYQSEQKKQISEKAASHVADGDTIFFDSGTTHMSMVEMLTSRKQVTIVTNNLLLAVKAADLDCGFNVVMIPGNLHNDTISIVGDLASDFLGQFYFDKVFLTTSGISLENGFSNRTLPECSIKKTVLNRTRKAFVLANELKFGENFPFSFANFQNVDYIITNRRPAQVFMDAFEQDSLECLF